MVNWIANVSYRKPPKFRNNIFTEVWILFWWIEQINNSEARSNLYLKISFVRTKQTAKNEQYVGGWNKTKPIAVLLVNYALRAKRKRQKERVLLEGLHYLLHSVPLFSQLFQLSTCLACRNQLMVNKQYFCSTKTLI